MPTTMHKLNSLLWIAGLMVAVFITTQFIDYTLLQYGILPRNPERMWCIFSAPFLHINVNHLLNNLLGFFIFGSLCLVRSPQFFLRGSLFIVTVGGLLVWAVGRPTLHVGASGWVFGLWSMTIAMAWVDRRFWSIAIAVLVIVFYGGMVWGILPGDPRVSFESHFFGALAGIVFALTYGKRYRLR